MDKPISTRTLHPSCRRFDKLRLSFQYFSLTQSMSNSYVCLYISAHNQLQYLPVEMWSAPMLTDLNVANNSLKELPAPTVVSVNTAEKIGRHLTCM